jgi:hypothetical protein
MGTRAKLVASLLVTLAIALPVVVLLAVSTPQSLPDMVEPIDLPAGEGDQGAGERADAPAADRKRQRSGRGAPPDGPASNSPTIGAMSDPGSRVGGSPNARRTPVSDIPAAPRNAPAAGERLSEPSELPQRSEPPQPSESPEQPDPPEPPDPPEETATPATVEPVEQPDPADGDPPEAPDPADAEPSM